MIGTLVVLALGVYGYNQGRGWVVAHRTNTRVLRTSSDTRWVSLVWPVYLWAVMRRAIQMAHEDALDWMGSAEVPGLTTTATTTTTPQCSVM